MSGWETLGAEDFRAGWGRHHGELRTAPLRWGRRRALSDYHAGWDRAELAHLSEQVERTRALADAPLIGRTLASLEGSDYATRRETALGLATQAAAEPGRTDLKAMLAGAVASVQAASGLDTEGEAYARAVELFQGSPVPEIAACDALREFPT